MTEINATIAASAPTGKVDAELSIKDQPLRVSVNVPDEPIGLSEIVPLARQLADEIVRRTVANIRREGKSISCRKRCTACCSYRRPALGSGAVSPEGRAARHVGEAGTVRCIPL